MRDVIRREGEVVQPGEVVLRRGKDERRVERGHGACADHELGVQVGLLGDLDCSLIVSYSVTFNKFDACGACCPVYPIVASFVADLQRNPNAKEGRRTSTVELENGKERHNVDVVGHIDHPCAECDISLILSQPRPRTHRSPRIK